MAGRGLSVYHPAVWRLVPACARGFAGDCDTPELQMGEKVHKRDVRVAGRWMYLCRTVDHVGQRVDFYLSETGDRERQGNCCGRHSRTPITGRRTSSPLMLTPQLSGPQFES
jgi:hypothetical protein